MSFFEGNTENNVSIYVGNDKNEANGRDVYWDKTKETLEYRKKYPEASLKELSEIISIETTKPITKSGLNHRLRKIKELAERLQKNK